MTALDRFAANRFERENAQKRRPRDAVALEPEAHAKRPADAGGEERG